MMQGAMVATLYTLGYQQRSIDDYIALLREATITVVVDVRDTAWSHKADFRKAALSTALAGAGIGYVHAGFAGAPKWLRSIADTHREILELYDWYIGEFGEIVTTFDDLVAGLHVAHKRVCLTCFERHPDDCHRSILADRWRRAGKSRAVMHLATDGCERLVTA